MSAYTGEFNAAIERSKRFGLKVPDFVPDPARIHMDAKAHKAFPYVVRDTLGNLELSDIVLQCMSIHLRLVPVIEEWLGCKALYTIGWIDDNTEKGLFRFDDTFITEKLADGHRGSSVNLHAWLTLPSMEVIDVALSTSFGRVHNIPEMIGGVIAAHPDTFKGMAYKPMLIGEDFLRKTGLLLEF